MEFFAKFVLCSNNELNPIHIEQGENRYWVRKVPTITNDNPNFLGEIKKELPAFLWLLLRRTLSTSKESRMWFCPNLLMTDALRKIIHHNRNKTENEMMQIALDIMETEKLTTLMFCIVDMVFMLELRGLKSEHSHVRRILQNNWELRPSEPKHYICYRLNHDGTIQQTAKTGRCYTITKEKLEFCLLLC